MSSFKNIGKATVFDFDNIGGKIKHLAKILCYTGISIALIYASYKIFILGIFASDPNIEESEKISEVIEGIIIGIIGPIVSWICSFFMYGFGQLIENTDILVGNNKINSPAPVTKAESIQKKYELPSEPFDDLMTAGLISKEECDYLTNQYNSGHLTKEACLEKRASIIMKSANSNGYKI